MDKLKLVDKLRAKANISYEEAKKILEDNNWDMLDAVLYLESIGKIKKPEVSAFYTNEYKEKYILGGELAEVNANKEQEHFRNNSFHGIFETICKVIDTLNNIFLEIKTQGKVLFKLPFTVLILLLFFTFWITIPLMIVGLFFDIEFSVSTKNIGMYKLDKVNEVLRQISKYIKHIKDEFKKRFN